MNDTYGTSAKDVYSNAGSASLLLIRRSILELFADGTSTH